MPTDLFYTSGQAARELGVGQSAIRALCGAGAIACETTPGGQYRVSKTVVERLKRDGLPEVPRPLPADSPRPNRARHGHPALLAEPSDNAIESAEGVVVVENQVKRRKLERELEETEDWFRERDEREAEREAAQEREEREERRRTEAERGRRLWLEQWTGHALGLIPSDAPHDVRLDVAEAVRRTLEPLDPGQADSLTERLVDAAVTRALSGWQRSKDIERAIKRACDKLPFDMKYRSEDAPWRHRATQTAAEAIAGLRDGASSAEMEAAAAVALKPLVAEFEHREACQKIIKDTWMHLRGWTNAELEEAKEAVKQAVEALPVGAGRREMEKARDAALAPIQAAVDQRRDRELRQDVIRRARLPWGLSRENEQGAQAAIRKALDDLPPGTFQSDLEKARDRVVERYRREREQQEKKQRLIEAGLSEIYAYLQKLERERDLEPARGKTTWSIAEDLKPAIREALAAELDGDESPEDVARLTRRLVREELDLL